VTKYVVVCRTDGMLFAALGKRNWERPAPKEPKLFNKPPQGWKGRGPYDEIITFEEYEMLVMELELRG